MSSAVTVSSIPRQGFVVALAVLMIAAASCESSGESSAPTIEASDTTATSTSRGAPTTTGTAIDTASSSEESDDQEVLEVTFDGSMCTTTGPTVVTSGVHSFVLKDLTGEGLADVRTMAISDGHTYEDLLDLQSEAGEYVPLPEWAEWPLTTFEPVDRELGDHELGKRLILDPGVHGIVVGTGKGLWFCGPLSVTES